MQNEIMQKQALLDEFGHVRNPGYAKSMLYQYKREDIKASKFRIKEWDYYLVSNETHGFAFTIADNGYMGFISVSVLNFKEKTFETFSDMLLFPLGKLNMPSSSISGDVVYKGKKIELEFKHVSGNRVISCKIPNFKNKLFEAELVLTNEPKESMVIATPFKEKKHAFYFNQKINYMNANGIVRFGNITFDIKDYYAILDWGRGVWTYDNTWYWGSASGKINDKPFGFNIGYGFGDTSEASENMIFYDGIANKFDRVRFNIPKNGKKYQFLKEWQIVSSDERMNLIFSPYLDRFDKISLLVIVSDQHQVFGTFSGTVVLDDGTTLEIKDVHGFAEMVHNRW